MFSKYILGSIGVISSVIGTVVQSVEIAHVENKKLILAFGKQPQGYPERQRVEWLEDLA